MFSYVPALGHYGIEQLRHFGQAGLLLFRSIFRVPNVKKGLPLLIQQIYAEGVLSLLIIVVSSLFIGMVLALQGYHTLSKFGASQELGPLVALSVPVGLVLL
jgi:phospholipid/cholesterol/gamma-HCH transport system permease protein